MYARQVTTARVMAQSQMSNNGQWQQQQQQHQPSSRPAGGSAFIENESKRLMEEKVALCVQNTKLHEEIKKLKDKYALQLDEEVKQLRESQAQELEKQREAHREELMSKDRAIMKL